MFYSVDIKTVWRRLSEDKIPKCTVDTMKHDGRSVTFVGCMRTADVAGNPIMEALEWYIAENEVEKYQRSRKTYVQILIAFQRWWLISGHIKRYRNWFGRWYHLI